MVGFCSKTYIFAGIQFTKHFIECVLVEMNQLIGSTSHVILIGQTCSNRSSRVAGSKRRVHAFYFSVRIWYTFWTLKCRGKPDLSLCMTSVLAKRMRLCSAELPCGWLIEHFKVVWKPVGFREPGMPRVSCNNWLTTDSALTAHTSASICEQTSRSSVSYRRPSAMLIACLLRTNIQAICRIHFWICTECLLKG